MSDSLNAISNSFSSFFEAVLKEKPILIQEISLPLYLGFVFDWKLELDFICVQFLLSSRELLNYSQSVIHFLY